MKKLLPSIFIIFSFSISAQNVGINSTGAPPSASAMLDVASTTSGFLVPRMTTAQRTAIGAPAAGLLVFDTSLNTFLYWDGAVWRLMATSGGWLLAGNVLTGTEFLGSTNAQPVRFFTNNLERLRIMATGEMVINGLAPAFVGDNFTVYGQYPVNVYSTISNCIGYYASVSASNARGIVSLATGLNAFGGIFSGSGTNAIGVDGTSNSATGFGGDMFNSNTSGTALITTGNNVAGQYLVTGSGAALNGTGTGVWGRATSTPGTGGIFTGNGVAANSAASGSGISAIATTLGVYAVANNAGNNNWGGFFTNGNASGFAFVGGRTGGLDYKINGPGAVATMVKNKNDQYVNMFCPEAPEILFEDYGEAQLINGKCIVALDEIFSKNVAVNAKHPLRVFVQLEGNCNGVYITNKTSVGFEVIELVNGQSNTKFTYHVIANRANSLNENGSIDSQFEDARFPLSPKKVESVNLPSQSFIQSKASTIK
jgi:hypothetical protein